MCATVTHGRTIIAGDKKAEPRSLKFAIATRSLMKSCYGNLKRDYRRVEEELADAKRGKIWEHFECKSLDELLKADGLESESSVRAAIKLAHESDPELHKDMRLPDWGEIGQGRNRGDNITSIKRGTDPSYLSRRIARDRPDVLQRMKDGEFRSVNAAAIEAGIVKVPTPLEVAKKAYAKLGKADRKAFTEWLQRSDR